MSLLLTADLHLTSKPRDEDRWALFPWLEKQVRKHKIDHVAILGDLTDAKDRHDSGLVNRLVATIRKLAQVTKVYILRGNHDFIDENNPFFRFLDNNQDVHYINEPKLYLFDIGGVVFIPCTRDVALFQQQVEQYSTGSYILTHQTYNGALAENGTRLHGIPPSVFEHYQGRVWSGDIHTPQKVGKKIEYVGSPYPVKFGDDYTPRCVLLLPDAKPIDLHFPFTLKKFIDITDPDMELPEYPKGSQVKLRVHLRRRELADWPKLRKTLLKQALQRGWEVCAVMLTPVAERAATPLKTTLQGDAKAIVKDYAQRKRLDADFLKAGSEFLA